MVAVGNSVTLIIHRVRAALLAARPRRAVIIERARAALLWAARPRRAVIIERVREALLWAARPGRVFVAGGLVSLPILLSILLWLPEWMVDQYRRTGALTRDQYTKAVDDYRKTVAQIVAGVGGLYGLHLIRRRTRV